MKFYKAILFLTLINIYILGLCQAENNQIPYTAIIGAFEEEILLLENSVTNKEKIEIFGLKFITGRLYDKDVVIAYTGMGKVNAAMTTTLIIEHFLPSGLIFTGIAGGLNPDLNPGDIVIAENSVQHDLVFIHSDTLIPFQPDNPLNNRQNPVYFNSDSSLFHSAISIIPQIILHKIEFADTVFTPKIITGTIATGDSFIASSVKKDELIKYYHADCVEMEGAAVAQICCQKKVPCIVIRSISDSADENAQYDINVFLKTAANNSALLVLKLLEIIK